MKEISWSGGRLDLGWEEWRIEGLKWRS